MCLGDRKDVEMLKCPASETCDWLGTMEECRDHVVTHAGSVVGVVNPLRDSLEDNSDESVVIHEDVGQIDLSVEETESDEGTFLDPTEGGYTVYFLEQSPIVLKEYPFWTQKERENLLENR